MGEVRQEEDYMASAESEPLRIWTTFLAGSTVPVGLKLYEAISKWDEITSTTETSFNLAFGTDEPFFQYLSSSAEVSQKFAVYMKAVSTTRDSTIHHLPAGYGLNQFSTSLWSMLAGPLVMPVLLWPKGMAI